MPTGAEPKFISRDILQNLTFLDKVFQLISYLPDHFLMELGALDLIHSVFQNEHGVLAPASTKEAKLQQEIIRKAGNILFFTELEDSQLMGLIGREIGKQTQMAVFPSLKVVNNLYNYHITLNQSRVISDITRMIVDSKIFWQLAPLIRQELRSSTARLRWDYSIAINSIRLVENLCVENPHVIVENSLTDSGLIEMVFDLFNSSPHLIPTDEDSIITITNFFHHICLKESRLRDLVITPLHHFVRELFSHNAFLKVMNGPKEAVIMQNIIGMAMNLHFLDAYVYQGLTAALACINQQYRQFDSIFDGCSSEGNFPPLDQFPVDIWMMMQELAEADCKISAILRFCEMKTGGKFKKAH